jgi:vitamin B12 transporter
VKVWFVVGVAALAWSVSATTGAAQDTGDQSETSNGTPATFSEQVVVTASARPERIGDTAATVQVLDRAALDASPASTVTGLLAEYGVAYLGQWSPSQTQVSLRGASTDGQGRDFRSQVEILVNGRRAGTANVSKLSLQDLERIEIVRGPGSLLYGSQAMGGVVNLITRSGARGESQQADMRLGSWGQVDGGASQTDKMGKFDYAVGAHGGRRGDYESGAHSAESMTNTAYSQRGALFEAGYSRSPRERLSATVRTDGIYNAGFRGSQWDTDNVDTRYNRSVDVIYSRTLGRALSLNAQYYFFHDVDDLRWGTEVVRLGNGLPGPGFDTDNNTRINQGNGFKSNLTSTPWQSGTLLTGIDGEWSTLRSDRVRTPMPGAATTQIAPFDNNADAWNTAFYAEHVQRFAGDRFSVRGGARYDRGNQAVKATPNQPLLAESDAPYDSVTYRLATVARVTPSWSVRGGVATGYRAPTASELTANYTTVQGGQVLGNPDLNPERTVSVDVGTLLSRGPFSLDVDLFHNRIRDRISTVAITGSRTEFVNRGTSDITGIDVQGRANVATWGRQTAWVGGNGTYNFVMRDNDAIARGLNSDRIDRMSEYLASLQVGLARARSWDLQLSGSLNGPIWYDTEENLLVPAAEPTRTWVHRKDPFWMWDVTGSHPIAGSLRLRASVTNLLDVNAHPTFIALNREPFLSDPRFSNGGHGNSLPGRAFQIGLEWRR